MRAGVSTMADAGKDSPQPPLSGETNEALLARLRDPTIGTGLRQKAVEELGRRRLTAAVPELIRLAGTESNDNARNAVVVSLGQIGSPEAQKELLAILRTEAKAFIRISAAYWLGRNKAPGFVDSYADLVANESDQQVRFKTAMAAAKLDPDVAERLILTQLRGGVDDSDLRGYLIHALGEIRAQGAVEYLTTVLKDDKDGDARIASASSLQEILGGKASQIFADVLPKSQDAALRKRLATLLGKSGDDAAIVTLTGVLVNDKAVEVRQAAATALAQVVDTDRKESALIDALKKSKRARNEIDPSLLITAVAGDAGADRQSFAEYLIKQAPDADERMTGVLAALIIASFGGSVELAGLQINTQAADDERYRQLRIDVGGQLALNPILSALYQNLQKNFTQPIAKLNRKTEKDWRRTVRAAHLGFQVRMWMSIVVFVVGIVILSTSAYQFLFTDVSGARLWGTGVTFAGGLGAMLAVIYAGPLRDIRRSVNDLGGASAAFIGFIHRVLQTSHTYSYFYLKSAITFDQTEEASQLISSALLDMRLSFQDSLAASSNGSQPKARRNRANTKTKEQATK